MQQFLGLTGKFCFGEQLLRASAWISFVMGYWNCQSGVRRLCMNIACISVSPAIKVLIAALLNTGIMLSTADLGKTTVEIYIRGTVIYVFTDTAGTIDRHWKPIDSFLSIIITI
jgi:hypothetical protein